MATVCFQRCGDIACSLADLQNHKELDELLSSRRKTTAEIRTETKYDLRVDS